MHNLLIVCLQRVESCRCVPAKELPIVIRGWLTRRNALFFELLPSHSAAPLVSARGRRRRSCFVAIEVIRSAIAVAKIFYGSTVRNAALPCSTANVRKYRQARLGSIHAAELSLMFREPVHLAWCGRGMGGIVVRPAPRGS